MNTLTVNFTTAAAHVRDRAREEDRRPCSGRVDRAIRAARSARFALERAGG